MKTSLFAYLLCVTLLLAGGLIYYPKWKLERTEATISWDVSGYYYYLPAFLIYKDTKRLAWHQEITDKYYPAPGDQAYQHESGNMVMKYSLGLAVQFLPFFLIADLTAPALGFADDGFSLPYQLAITLGSLLIACLGLWILRRLLLHFFDDHVVAWTLITIVFASNYLDYASINHAMTHNYLFTAYAILLLITYRYWQRPRMRTAVWIGGLCGLMALTRPTELIAVLIPFCWGLDSKPAIRERLMFFRKNPLHVMLAGLMLVLVGSLQMLYWKYATGEWIVYSYQDQGFSWLSPHIINGMFSYRAGWLVYSPAMILSLIGFVFLWKKDKKLFYPVLLFSVLFMYITWAWDIWWYGGSLGQRAMVQLYPVLAIPVAACIAALMKHRAWRIAGLIFLLLCTYYNLWLTHQAHRGGLLRAGDMTKAYFWKLLGKYHLEEEAQFLLDSRDWYDGMQHGTQLVSQDFETDTISTRCSLPAISGVRSACVTAERAFLPRQEFSVPSEARWIRATGTFRCEQKEWDVWKMAQFRIQLLQGDEAVKTSFIRIYRALNNGETQRFSVDLKIPKGKSFDRGVVDVWNADSPKPLAIDDLTVVWF